jgi:hypothetical protein
VSSGFGDDVCCAAKRDRYKMPIMRLAYVLCAKNKQEIETLQLQIANEFIQSFPHAVWIIKMNKMVSGVSCKDSRSWHGAFSSSERLGLLSFNLISINCTMSPYKYHTQSYIYSSVGQCNKMGILDVSTLSFPIFLKSLP